MFDGGDQCRVKKVLCLADGKEYVMKIQRKSQIRGGDVAPFRMTTERLLNMPPNEHVVAESGRQAERSC